MGCKRDPLAPYTREEIADWRRQLIMDGYVLHESEALSAITPEELQRAREWCRTYGPANCWTGTSGSVAATLVKLIESHERNEQRSRKPA